MDAVKPETEDDRQDRKMVAELLEQAAALVAQARALLDTEEHACSGCNRKAYQNWTEAQAHEQLGGTLTKLARWEQRFRAGPTAQAIEKQG